MENNEILQISIDLTAIPKEKIKNHVNGKKYISVDISKKKEIDIYGKEISVYINSINEISQKWEKIFIGSGRIKTFNKKEGERPSIIQKDIKGAEDLPF